jgi:hypothetical protein
MSVIPWVGARRVAIVPVLDLQVDQEPPPDWEYRVHSRVFYDPQPGTGLDQSFHPRVRLAGQDASARLSIRATHQE